MRMSATEWETKATMNHRHRKVLHAVFAHPVNANINFRDIEHLFVELGAEIDAKAGNRIGVTLKGHSAAFHHGGHSLPLDDVVQVRKFLETCGVAPSDFPV